jgi:hypothetical protein
MHGYNSQFMVQGVHMIFDGELGPDWEDKDSKTDPLDEKKRNNELKNELKQLTEEFSGEKELFSDGWIGSSSELVQDGKGVGKEYPNSSRTVEVCGNIGSSSSSDIEMKSNQSKNQELCGRRSRLVLIGLGLNADVLRLGFLACEHQEEEDR